MTTYYDLSGFQRDILQAIAAVEEIPYGLALKDYLDERYSDPINHSRLYQNLDQLIEQDLVECAPIDDRTNAYTLTDAGQTLLEHQADTLAQCCDRPRPVTDGGRPTKPDKSEAEQTTSQTYPCRELVHSEPSMTMAVCQHPPRQWLAIASISVASTLPAPSATDSDVQATTPAAGQQESTSSHDVRTRHTESVGQNRTLGRSRYNELLWILAVAQRPCPSSVASTITGRTPTKTAARERSVEQHRRGA